jgi:hypothetical protein
MRPTMTVVVRCFDGSLSLPCRFDLGLQCRDIVLELCDAASSCAASLALMVVNVATAPRSEAVAVANWAI